MKLKLSLSLLGILIASTVCASLRAQGQDLQGGRLLAQRVCAECHAVQRHEPSSPNAQAPTFQQLSSTPGMTSAALSVAFATPHAGMPMFRLTPEQAADLIAYILSLR